MIEKPKVTMYRTGSGNEPVTLVMYEAKVAARSWDEAEVMLCDFMAKELEPRINGRIVKGIGFRHLCETPKSVLQWFMDLILGQQSERDFYFTVEVQLQRLNKAKA